MKTIFLTTAMVLLVSMFAMGNKIVAKGSSNSAFGNYKIEQLDDHMMLQGKELDKYMITYENSDMKVVVVLDKQKNCRKYYVLSDEVPVQYECNGVYFGIKKLDDGLLSSGFATSMEKLDKQVYFHQKVLASGATEVIDHLGLIASYYPEFFCKKVS